MLTEDCKLKINTAPTGQRCLNLINETSSSLVNLMDCGGKTPLVSVINVKANTLPARPCSADPEHRIIHCTADTSSLTQPLHPFHVEAATHNHDSSTDLWRVLPLHLSLGAAGRLQLGGGGFRLGGGGVSEKIYTVVSKYNMKQCLSSFQTTRFRVNCSF